MDMYYLKIIKWLVIRNIPDAKEIIFKNGDGVSEEMLSRLFDSFYRGDVSRTNPSQGSGLGLAIAKSIVEAHNGEIKAVNNNGLTIIIKLPMFLD